MQQINQQANNQNWVQISPYYWIEVNMPLGKGGFGVVYNGVSYFTNQQGQQVSQPFAVKELKKYFNKSLNNQNEYYDQEVIAWKKMKQIKNQNIVQIHDFFMSQTDHNMHYIVMDLCNRDLSKLRKERPDGKLPTMATLKIINQVAHGIKALHDLNICHRDIKPDNIFIQDQPDGSFICKVGDFGLGKTDILQSKVGTICYMAPDMLRFDKLDYNLKVDVWALGIMTHELLTGVLLFTGQSPDIIRNIILRYNSYKSWHDESLKRSNYQRNFVDISFQSIESEYIVDLIDRMLEKDPQKRMDINETISMIEQTIITIDNQKYVPQEYQMPANSKQLLPQNLPENTKQNDGKKQTEDAKQIAELKQSLTEKVQIVKELQAVQAKKEKEYQEKLSNVTIENEYTQNLLRKEIEKLKQQVKDNQLQLNLPSPASNPKEILSKKQQNDQLKITQQNKIIYELQQQIQQMKQNMQ